MTIDQVTIRKRGRPIRTIRLKTPEKIVAKSFKYHKPQYIAQSIFRSGPISDSVKSTYCSVRHNALIDLVKVYKCLIILIQFQCS